jgi:hypothetical protein
VFKVVLFEHGIDCRVVIVSEAVEACILRHGTRSTMVPGLSSRRPSGQKVWGFISMSFAAAAAAAAYLLATYVAHAPCASFGAAQ